MTQTVSSIPSTGAPAASSKTQVPVRSNRAIRIAAVAVGAIAVVTVAITLVGLPGPSGGPTAPELFSVAPTSFSVVLKEKGELQAANATEIVCRVEGRSTIISLVPEGTAVDKGDLLVELASDQIEDRIRQEELKEANAFSSYEAAKAELDIQTDKNASDIRKAELEIALAETALEKYNEGDWVQMLRDADIAIEQAKINLERRAEDYKASQELVTRDYITRTQFEEDEFNFKKAQWDVEKAQLTKKVLQDYTNKADLQRLRSDVSEAKKELERVKKNAEAQHLKKQRDLESKETELNLVRDQLAKLRSQKEKCRIVAPTQGFVVYYSGGGRRHFMSEDSQIREGATVHERQILMTLPDTSKMVVEVRVHEAKTNKLRIGQKAIIEIEGMPGRQFTGSVTKIAAVADTQNRWLNPDLKEYETEITLDRTDASLKPGVTAHTQILVETVTDSLAIPVQAIYAKGGKRYVFRQKGREVEPVPIQAGAIGEEWVQVVDGLAKGEQVLLAFDDAHRRSVPDGPARTSNGFPGSPGVTRGTGSPKSPSPAHARRPGSAKPSQTGRVKPSPQGGDSATGKNSGAARPSGRSGARSRGTE